MGPDLIRTALAEERLHNGQRLNLLRLVAVSVFLAAAVVFGVVLRIPDWDTAAWQFAAYWVAAALLFWLGQRSERGAAMASAGIPLVDVPMVFLLTRDFYERMEPGIPATFAIGVYAGLVVLAALSLDHWRIASVAITAAGFQTALMFLAGDPGDGAVAGAILIGITAVICAYGVHRTVRLIVRVTDERLRRERMGRYFSPQVAEILDAQGETTVRAEAREITVLFTDLRDFTALAEALPSEHIVAILNEFHTRMVDTLFAFGGTLDKYTGDGMMAYFGAPVPQSDHALRAVTCALALQEALARLNGERGGRGEAPLRMGVGIHTGSGVVGDIGAATRREYTAIGDAVNVAARIQELTKSVGADIVASGETRTQVGTALEFRPAGAFRVPGKAEPIECHVPIAREPAV